MKWLSTYRGYEIRHSTVRDGDGFARYDAEIKVDGHWQFASSEALDDDTVERDLDAFIERLIPTLREPRAVRALARQAHLLPRSSLKLRALARSLG